MVLPCWGDGLWDQMEIFVGNYGYNLHQFAWRDLKPTWSKLVLISGYVSGRWSVGPACLLSSSQWILQSEMMEFIELSQEELQEFEEETRDALAERDDEDGQSSGPEVWDDGS